MAQSPYICPHCQSENVMKKSLAFEQGISTATTKGGGVGIGLDGHISVMGGGATTTGITATAAKCAPPEQPKSMLKWAVLGGILVGAAIEGLHLGGDLVALPAFVAIVYFAWKDGKKKQAAWQQAMADWDKEYICLRCGKDYRAE